MKQALYESKVYDIELKSLLRDYEAGIKTVELINTEKKPDYPIGLIKFTILEYCKSRKIKFAKETQIFAACRRQRGGAPG